MILMPQGGSLLKNLIFLSLFFSFQSLASHPSNFSSFKERFLSLMRQGELKTKSGDLLGAKKSYQEVLKGLVLAKRNPSFSEEEKKELQSEFRKKAKDQILRLLFPESLRFASDILAPFPRLEPIRLKSSPELERKALESYEGLNFKYLQSPGKPRISPLLREESSTKSLQFVETLFEEANKERDPKRRQELNLVSLERLNSLKKELPVSELEELEEKILKAILRGKRGEVGGILEQGREFLRVKNYRLAFQSFERVIEITKEGEKDAVLKFYNQEALEGLKSAQEGLYQVAKDHLKAGDLLLTLILLEELVDRFQVKKALLLQNELKRRFQNEPFFRKFESLSKKVKTSMTEDQKQKNKPLSSQILQACKRSFLSLKQKSM